MTFNFSNLDALRIQKGRTVPYRLTMIPWDPAPVLHVSHAGDSNAGYQNALLKASKGRSRQIANGNISVELIREMRDTFRRLFPAYVVHGWENVRDAHGSLVPFSQAACADFVAALPDHILDDLTSFCSQAVNFLDDDMPTPDDVEALAGN